LLPPKTPASCQSGKGWENWPQSLLNSSSPLLERRRDRPDVAAGAAEAYAELHINAWDCAAGIVLVREAGGFTNDFFAGDGINAGNPLIATNAALCAKLAAVIGIST